MYFFVHRRSSMFGSFLISGGAILWAIQDRKGAGKASEKKGKPVLKRGDREPSGASFIRQTCWRQILAHQRLFKKVNNCNTQTYLKPSGGTPLSQTLASPLSLTLFTSTFGCSTSPSSSSITIIINILFHIAIIFNSFLNVGHCRNLSLV